MSQPILVFHGVSKTYRQTGSRPLEALKNISLRIEPGASVAIMGSSGSGKSTLLNLAAGIDLPSTGDVMLEGKNLARLSDRERTVCRRDAVGLVFQFFHLLPHLTLAENVALPAMIAGERPSTYRERVKELLEEVGLHHRASDKVSRLSGGEMQRAAICRALLRRPRLLLADEPTGNLDDGSGRAVMEMMLRLSAEGGSAVVFATHDSSLAAMADRLWHLRSGVLEIQ